MKKSPLTQAVGEYTRRVVSEDGKNYRHERQDMDPVIEHVKFLGEKVNKAPKAGNRNGWHYAGSIPITVVTDWCHNIAHIGYDAFARNEFGERQLFLKYFKANFSKLAPPKNKSSQILMPR